jgi:hypothetical protein
MIEHNLHEDCMLCQDPDLKTEEGKSLLIEYDKFLSSALWKNKYIDN